MRLAIAQASSRSRTWISAPRPASDAAMIVAPRHRRQLPRDARRDRVDAARRRARAGSPAPASSCSACANRSIATQSGLRAAVGDHQDLGRPGDHVDADRAEHAPLGRRDVGVAGADDLVDRRDRRGAVGERRDRLRAADGERARRRRRDAPRRAPADCARRPASGTTMTISADAGDLAPESRSSAPTTDTPPCRPGT